VLRRVLAVVGLVLFLGAFGLLAEQVYHLERVEPEHVDPAAAVDAPAPEPGP
jgi:hypothetical protein